MKRYARQAGVVAAALISALPTGVTATHAKGPVLEPAFALELQGTSEEAFFTPRGEVEGALMGSGEGRVDGRLKGTVRWSLYESSTAAACTMQFVGEIETEEGVTIPFEGQGFAIVPDPDAPSRWETAGAFRFEPDDPRYEWLSTTLFPWRGETNLDLVQARLDFHIPRGK